MGRLRQAEQAADALSQAPLQSRCHGTADITNELTHMD